MTFSEEAALLVVLFLGVTLSIAAFSTILFFAHHRKKHPHAGFPLGPTTPMPPGV